MTQDIEAKALCTVLEIVLWNKKACRFALNGAVLFLRPAFKTCK